VRLIHRHHHISSIFSIYPGCASLRAAGEPAKRELRQAVKYLYNQHARANAPRYTPWCCARSRWVRYHRQFLDITPSSPACAWVCRGASSFLFNILAATSVTLSRTRCSARFAGRRFCYAHPRYVLLNSHSHMAENSHCLRPSLFAERLSPPQHSALAKHHSAANAQTWQQPRIDRDSQSLPILSSGHLAHLARMYNETVLKGDCGDKAPSAISSRITALPPTLDKPTSGLHHFWASDSALGQATP